VINDYYNRKLERSVRNNSDDNAYPILRALFFVQIYKIFRLVIIIFTSSYFLGIIWHIMVSDVFVTNWIDPNDKSLGVGDNPLNHNFITDKLNPYDPDNKYTKFDTLVRVWYFAITTLSTIGYGDYHPVSTNERIIAVPILMIGVAVFSFIMGQFIEILMNYNQLWAVGNRKDLSKWIALLSRFNNGKPLNKSLITKIENFFEYYWNNNKLAALQTDADNRFMDELPASV
jgi:hypothetical protein